MATRARDARAVPPARGTLLTDIHARLYPSHVQSIVRPTSLEHLARIVRFAGRSGRSLSIAGGRHAMGGQQFGESTIHIDGRGLRRILAFDSVRGAVEAESGVSWPDLVSALHNLQPGESQPWTIAQKQTGADRMTLGGSLSANVHGRGLTMAPLVADIDSFTLVTADGRIVRVWRTENADLFRLVIGGYGLFGAVYSLRLNLVRRQVLQRRVVLTTTDELMPLLESRIADGFRYGDFQFAIDPASPDFLRAGIASCYRPIDPATPILAARQLSLAREDWQRLLILAHRNKSRAFDEYSAHYLRTDGQLYHSDTAQLGVYVDGYHDAIDPDAGEMIGEMYVPPLELPTFMARARAGLRATAANLIYGTVRVIRRDAETFLPWARRDWACIVINLCTPRHRAGIARSRRAFRGLIDAALDLGGSFYLTYHRFATRAQIAAAYPQFPEFLAHKRRLDPRAVFTSDWHRHTAALFGV